jgi:hypothetical protein
MNNGKRGYRGVCVFSVRLPETQANEQQTNCHGQTRTPPPTFGTLTSLISKPPPKTPTEIKTPPNRKDAISMFMIEPFLDNHLLIKA